MLNLDLKIKPPTPAYRAIAAKEVKEAEFIPYTGHLDDSTLITKSGDLIQVIKVEGMSFQTADDDLLLLRKQLRNTILKTVNDSRFAVYLHTLRRRSSNYPAGDFTPGFAKDLDKKWREKQSGLETYVNELYISLVQKAHGAGVKGALDQFKSLLDKGKNKKEAYQKRLMALKDLNSVSARFLSSLKDYGARLLGQDPNSRFSFSEPARFLYSLINLEDRPVLAPQMDLSRYLPSHRLVFGKDFLECLGLTETKMGAMLSLKEYPTETYPGILDKFLEIPCEFIITQSFLFEDRQTALHKIQTQQRKLVQTEDLAQSQIVEIDQALDDLSSGEIAYGKHHLTLLVLGKDQKEINRNISLAENVFVQLGILSVREEINLEPCFWAQLPGNSHFIVRDAMISSNNFAGFASLHNYPTGQREKNHWGPAVSVLETTSGTPYFFNFHLNDVGHTTLIGPTGTGKSVLLNFLLSQSLKFNPNIFFFDKDRGGEIFIRASGGIHTTLGLSKPTGFNPLQLSENEQNKAFLIEWLKLLLTSHEKSLSAKEEGIINSAIDSLFKIPHKDRNLRTLEPFLGIGPLSERLKLWYGKGSRANLFDNKEEVLKLDQKFYGFEMGEILEDEISLAPVVSYLFHRLNLALNGEPTIIVLEEGWKLLDNPFFAPRIKDWLQTIRKRNGFVIFLTPNIESAVNSSIGDTLVQQAATSIFLPNYKATKEGYVEAFKLSEREYELVRTLDPKSRCFLIKHGKDSVVAKLDLSGMEEFLNILSGNAKNVALLDEIRKEKGDNPDQWMGAFNQKTKERKVA